jgi:hypothetical protein
VASPYEERSQLVEKSTKNAGENTVLLDCHHFLMQIATSIAKSPLLLHGCHSIGKNEGETEDPAEGYEGRSEGENDTKRLSTQHQGDEGDTRGLKTVQES